MWPVETSKEEVIAMRLKWMVLWLVPLLGLTACMHTVVGGWEASPDGRYDLGMVFHGRSAHAYSDYTVKKVGITIFDVSKPGERTELSAQWAILMAADLGCDSKWSDGGSSLRLDFYEGPRGPASKRRSDRGFLLLRKEEATGRFQVTEHSPNIRLKRKVYFF